MKKLKGTGSSDIFTNDELYKKKDRPNPTSKIASQKWFIIGIVFLFILISSSVSGYYLLNWLHNPYIMPESQARQLFKNSIVYEQDKYIAFLKNHQDTCPVKLHFHKVTRQDKKGYWSIRKKYGLKSVHTIFSSNPFIEHWQSIIKDIIVVPDRDGLIHIAKKGETTYSVAQLYDKDPKDIAEINENFYGRFEENQIVFVPWGRLPLALMNEKMQSHYEKQMFVSPIKYNRIASDYGMRVHPIFKVKRKHNGIDLPAKRGTPVHAAADGLVVYKGWMRGYGKTVRLKHKHGYTTTYGHLSWYSRYLKPGMRVKKNYVIGKVGNTGWSTGPHLDFSIRKNGRPVDPLNYMAW
jgi:hypothetical protein